MLECTLFLAFLRDAAAIVHVNVSFEEILPVIELRLFSTEDDACLLDFFEWQADGSVFTVFPTWRPAFTTHHRDQVSHVLHVEVLPPLS